MPVHLRSDSVREVPNWRRFALAATVAVCLSPSPCCAAHYSILMIGNSYTQGRSTESAGGVDEDLQGIFAADGNHSATIVTRATSGWRLEDHADSLDTLNAITSGGDIWDVIILQEQSTLPAAAMKFGAGLNALRNGGPTLIELIKQQTHLQNTSVVLYNTWARELDESTLVDQYDNDPHQMQTYTNAGYDYIRQRLPTWNHSDITSIARVGDAWGQWYDRFGYGSAQTSLHDDDGSHQSGLGSYLAAAVLFETITGASSIGNTFAGSYQGGVAGSVEGQQKRFLLQQQASATTGVAAFGDFDQDDDVDGADFLAWQRGYGQPSDGSLAAGDGNLDGWVDAADLAIWANSYSPANGPLLTSIPEPASWTMLLVALISLSGRLMLQGISC